VKLVTLKNNFHNTEVRVRAYDNEGPWEAWDRIQAYAHFEYPKGKRNRLLRRVVKTLCGMKCACGVVRGPQGED